MRAIDEGEFRDNATAVLAAVEAGETFRITRDGVAIAELGPPSRHPHLTAEELVARHKRLRRVDYNLMRLEADEFFGSEERVDQRAIPSHVGLVEYLGADTLGDIDLDADIGRSREQPRDIDLSG